MKNITKKKIEPTDEQALAIKILQSESNVFLTGPAGVGKSFVINEFIKSRENKPVVLASTGAAAVLVGGRTFNSFFGIGIMEGGVLKTVSRAIKNPILKKRINEVKEVIIDEVSMISPEAFLAASSIAQHSRQNLSPFGGIRIIVVGDFLQIPPVNPKSEEKWLFQSPVWNELDFKLVELTKTMRTSDEPFIEILKKVRMGICDTEVKTFLDSRRRPLNDNFVGTVVFGRKYEVENYNTKKLLQLSTELHQFKTEVTIMEKKTKSSQNLREEDLVNQSPLPPILQLKVGALVMIRKNDLEGEYVNGSLGFVNRIETTKIVVTLLSKRNVTIEPDIFQLLDANGEIVAEVKNFPLTLGWATTIHKAQGTSIDRIHMNIKNLWDCGQAYVALSRSKDPNQLFIEDWSPHSIKADKDVIKYYQECKPEEL